jgi:hypothetical protein
MGGYSTIPSLISGYKYFRLPRQPFMYRVFFWQAKMDVVCADDTLGQRQRMMARTWNKSGSRTKLELLVSARNRGVFAFGSVAEREGQWNITCHGTSTLSPTSPQQMGFAGFGGEWLVGGAGRGASITGPCFRGRLWLSGGRPNPRAEWEGACIIAQ